MKFTIYLTSLLFHSFVMAQSLVPVREKVIDLGVIHETLGRGIKKVLLDLDESTPPEFKIKFKYKYQFVSHELDSVTITPGGIGGYSTRRIVQDYTGKQVLRFDIGESSIVRGEKILVLIEISKPNKNIHGIKVETKLLRNSSDSIEGGKKLLGLLGRSYTIKENCPESF
jgi:hypothetical protein